MKLKEKNSWLSMRTKGSGDEGMALGMGGDAAEILLLGHGVPGWRCSSLSAPIFPGLVAESACYWPQEALASLPSLPRICLHNNRRSEARSLAFPVVNNECCTSCLHTLKPSMSGGRKKKQIKRHQININLLRHPQIAPFRFQERYPHPLSRLALCVLPQNRTLGPRFWPSIKSSIFFMTG